MPLNLEIMLDRCRLCQLRSGTQQFIDNQEFINQVFECTKIKINNEHMHLLPKTVCPKCKLNIQEFFTFVQEIRVVDQKLKDLILKCDNSEPKLLECNKYPIDVSNSELLKKQIKTSVDKTNRFKCPACSKTYARYKNLQLHKRSHVNLYCRKCEITFADTLACKSHKCSTLKNYLTNKDCKDNCDISVLKKTNIDDINKVEVNHSLDINEVKVNHHSLDIENKVTKKEWFEDEFPANNKAVIIEDNIKNTEADNVVAADTSHEQLAQDDVNQKNKSRGSYSCEVCHENFVCNSDMRTHQKIHGITFSCTYENCNKVCTSAYTLRTHLMRHEGKMPFLCVTCGKGFTTKNSLNCHEKTHAKVKGYACKECNIGFSVASNLRAHQKKHHEGVRFYCSQCTRAFITKCSLERHELVHTGVKEFKCESCHAAFYTNKELLKHQRYHQGLRLYKCDRCFKTFFEKHHLTIHIRVHTGERPYACKVPGCGKSFTESQKLSRHMKARHPPV